MGFLDNNLDSPTGLQSSYKIARDGPRQMCLSRDLTFPFGASQAVPKKKAPQGEYQSGSAGGLNFGAPFMAAS